MMIRAGTGWQYALADLSLILFLATASALAVAGSARQAAVPPPPPINAALDAEPVAIWSDAPGAPPLAQWLTRTAADSRLEVRVVVRYRAGGRDAAMADALRLVAAGGPRAEAARILVEPGERAGASVSLFYASEDAARAPSQVAG
ncbi:MULTISPECIES: hypothetical protein [Novosphingobium]|uniref:hypothetical protein n=1 Tax=Novosphingobium TaxID=165696 RepID=UPI000D6E167B|nr:MULTISPECIES: hypothetical protein [Novosphingobium]